MSTIQIPASLQTALNTVTNAAVSQAIAELAEKYGFDAEEAGRDLKIPDVNFKPGKANKGFKKNGEPKKKLIVQRGEEKVTLEIRWRR